MVRYEIRVTGRVQGVGFRHYVMQKARELEIKGWVKNTVNGEVKVMAQGEKADVDMLMDYLQTGPTLSRVTNVSKYIMPELDEYSGFNIV